MKLTRTLKQTLLKVPVVRDVRERMSRALLMVNSSAAAKTGQLQLALSWKAMARRGEPLPSFGDVEFRAYSQNGEDGILLYLFSLIGTTNKVAVEICAGDGVQCNATNLILNHGWTGLLVDGSEEQVRKGRAFFASHPDTFSFPPTFAHEWVERETINDVIAKHGIGGEIDLLSIDLDGVDYWVWDALDVIRPRVVVVETQCIWGADVAVTVPYARDFQAPLVDGFGIYGGASLPAFVKLGRRKGYRLVGAQALGFNAFFLRDDLGIDLLPEVVAASCLDRPFVRWAAARFLPLVRDKAWVEV